MVKVENKRTLRMLVKHFMKVNRSRNIIAVLAIILTTTLFTSVFTAAFSMIESNRDSEIRQNMSSSHTVAQNMTREEYQKALTAIQEDKGISRYGVGLFLGLAVNDELSEFQTEVRYADENMAESFLCRPTEGRLPESEDEIACSTLVLAALGIEPRLGEVVNIILEERDGYNQTYSFKLTGFWEGDSVVKSQLAFVSKSFSEKTAYLVTRDELENGVYNGGYEIAAWFSNIWNLEEKVKSLNTSTGIDGNIELFTINPAYILFQEDSIPFGSLFVILVIILLAGYLIIYNIFNISVNVDIRIYGLLKNIGTTGKQLKKIVRIQALRLSVMGIPAGVLAGYGIGCAMMPSLLADEDGGIAVSLSVNPLIFAAAILFTLITVYIACALPCRMVQRVSPVQAIKITENSRSHKKYKNNSSISSGALALENICRTWKKGVVVMISIALSLITLNSIVILISGFDFKEYVRYEISSDFAISKITGSGRSSNLQGISPALREILDQAPDSETNGYIYFSEAEHYMDEVLYENVKKLYENTYPYMNDEAIKCWEESLQNRTIRAHLIGVNEGLFEKLEFRNDALSWEEFKTGKYVIVDYPDYDENARYYTKGDTLTVTYTDKSEKDYQVLGEAKIAYALDYPWYDPAFMTIIVPESEYLACSDNQNAMWATLDAKPGKEEAVNDYIQKYVITEYENLRIDSILELREEFQTYLMKYYLVGGILTAVLALIGVMNFFNTSATSVLARKKELTLLEVVGMTKKQVQKMLVMEGCIYLAGALIIAMTVILTISEKILNSTVGIAWFFHFNMTIVPCLLMIPILLLIAYIVPTRNYQRMCKESMVERVQSE